MRLLLDTHTFLWWLTDSRSLSRKAHAAIEDDENEIFISAASAWEIATKFRIGKLEQAAAVAADVGAAIAGEGFEELAVSVTHAQLAGALPGDHKDPFDRMLISQAMQEQMTFVTNESRFEAFAIKRLW